MCMYLCFFIEDWVDARDSGDHSINCYRYYATMLSGVFSQSSTTFKLVLGFWQFAAVMEIGLKLKMFIKLDFSVVA